MTLAFSSIDNLVRSEHEDAGMVSRYRDVWVKDDLLSPRPLDAGMAHKAEAF